MENTGNIDIERRRRRAAQRRRKRRIRAIQKVIRIIVIAVVLTGIIAFIINWFLSKDRSASTIISEYQGLSAEDFESHPEWTEDFLTQNRYSRPGIALEKVENIYVHYVANPGTTAKQNRDYFQNLSITGERNASAHFIIGCEGEVIQCIPLNEIGYAVKGENERSISIECCHPTEDGSFTEATYESLLELLRWLLDVYDLDKDDVLRHYDSNGKLCPLYYVEHEDAWEQLKADI